MAARRYLLALIVLGFAAAAWAEEMEYATLDRMMVKPKVPVRAVVGSGTVGLELFHLFPTSLHHFKIVPRSEYLDVTIVPAEMPEFKPTTIESFALKVVVKGEPKTDRVKLSVGMAADELRSDKQFTFTVPLTKKAEEEVNQAYVVPVGEIEVNVRRFGEEIYYLYVIPILALLAWLFWRKRSVAKVRTDSDQ